MCISLENYSYKGAGMNEKKRILNFMKYSSGFTIVELMIALSLLAIVLAGAYQLMSFTQASWTRAAAESRVIQDARNVMIMMGNEIRQARSPDGEMDPVVLIASNEISIYTDVTGDGIPELVVYHRPGEPGEGIEPLRRSVVISKDTEYPYSYEEPSDWENVVSAVLDCVFEIGEEAPRVVVNVSIVVDDSESSLAKPVRVEAELAVRSRGGAQ
jgi:prepilin-type N-terminal cleavage/methylation domain-containing protein